jgi:hypothetical protein
MKKHSSCFSYFFNEIVEQKDEKDENKTTPTIGFVVEI